MIAILRDFFVALVCAVRGHVRKKRRQWAFPNESRVIDTCRCERCDACKLETYSAT